MSNSRAKTPYSASLNGPVQCQGPHWMPASASGRLAASALACSIFRDCLRRARRSADGSSASRKGDIERTASKGITHRQAAIRIFTKGSPGFIPGGGCGVPASAATSTTRTPARTSRACPRVPRGTRRRAWRRPWQRAFAAVAGGRDGPAGRTAAGPAPKPAREPAP